MQHIIVNLAFGNTSQIDEESLYVLLGIFNDCLRSLKRFNLYQSHLIQMYRNSKTNKATMMGGPHFCFSLSQLSVFASRTY